MTHKIEYLTKGINDTTYDMHDRVASVCDLYARSGWEVVNVDFQGGSTEVRIVLRIKEVKA